MNKLVIIARGVPGAGKTTYLNRVFSGAARASADDYFMENGSYKWDPGRLQEAHDYCYNRFLTALFEGQSRVVVDNTNVRIKHFERYVSSAKEHGYKVAVIRFDVDPVAAARRNVHGVPVSKVCRMAHDMEPYPGEIVFRLTA